MQKKSVVVRLYSQWSFGCFNFQWISVTFSISFRHNFISFDIFNKKSEMKWLLASYANCQWRKKTDPKPTIFVWNESSLKLKTYVIFVMYLKRNKRRLLRSRPFAHSFCFVLLSFALQTRSQNNEMGMKMFFN